MKTFSEMAGETNEAKSTKISPKFEKAIIANAMPVITAIGKSANLNDALKKIAKLLKTKYDITKDPRTGEALQVSMMNQSFFTADDLLNKIERIANDNAF